MNKKDDNTLNIPLSISDQLRNLIACGALPSGMRLGQTELATRFKSSRVPVREALKLLSAEGILFHDPNRGFFVSELSCDEARQLFRMRTLIEDELLFSIVWPDKEKLDQLWQHAELLETLLNSGNRAQWWIEHREFHNHIFDLSPNHVFIQEGMRLWSLTDRYRSILPIPYRHNSERQLVNKHSLVEALAEQNREKLLQVRAERRTVFEKSVLEILKAREL